MIITRSCWAISSLGLLLFCAARFVTSADENLSRPKQALTLSVDIAPKVESNLVLRLRLTNAGTNTLLIPLGYLPWNLYAMTLVLVEADDPFSRQMKQESGIADPLPGEPHQVKSGQTIEGRIDLTRRYPDLAEKIKRTDVLVFWSYHCPTEGLSSERVGGWLILPRENPTR